MKLTKSKLKEMVREELNERRLDPKVKKAILIAIEMSGNMTGATDKIEKIKKGLSSNKKVKSALRLANESINESSLYRRASGLVKTQTLYKFVGLGKAMKHELAREGFGDRQVQEFLQELIKKRILKP